MHLDIWRGPYISGGSYI